MKFLSRKQRPTQCSGLALFPIAAGPSTLHKMATPEHSDLELQLAMPPTSADIKSAPAVALTWLKTSIAAIYSAGKHRDNVPKLARQAYLDFYSTGYEYCRVTRISHGSLSGKNLYNGLKDEIKTYCMDAGSRIRAPEDDTDIEHARHVAAEYDIQWRRLQLLAGLVAHLLQPLENDWIRRSIAERRTNVHAIRELHTVVWKETILQVGVDSTVAETGPEIAKAIARLQRQQHEDGSAGDGKEGIERFLDHLRTIGVRLGQPS